MPRSLVMVPALFALAHPGLAHAQPAPPPAPPPPATGQPVGSSAAPAPGVRTHDGFYARLALGFGSLSMERTGKVSGEGTGYLEGKSTISGGVGASELSLGGTVSGFVIQGTILSARLTEPVIEHDAGEVAMGGPLGLFLLGPGVDWYPDVTGGFHVGLTLGIGAVGGKAPDGSIFENLGGAGSGASLALGYDFWIAEQWSLGVGGRFTTLAAHGESTVRVAGVEVKGEEDDAVGVLALYLGAVYH